MQVRSVEGGYAIRLEPGEELIKALADFMRRHDFPSGSVTGLGAVDRVRLGCYLVAEKDYSDRLVEGDHEVVGLTGTMTWYDGQPFPHLHVMLTDADFHATGGHCFEARVSATLELHVRDWGVRVERKMNEAVGLHLMDLG
jgi:predicted DNA-binding protein with PD1-like motif